MIGIPRRSKVGHMAIPPMYMGSYNRVWNTTTHENLPYLSNIIGNFKGGYL